MWLSLLFVLIASLRLILLVRSVNLILLEKWNPYNEPPEYKSDDQYVTISVEIIWVFYSNGGNQAEVAKYLCEREEAWKLLRHPNRAEAVSEEIAQELRLW